MMGIDRKPAVMLILLVIAAVLALGGCSNKTVNIGVNNYADKSNDIHVLTPMIPGLADFRMGQTFQDQPVITKTNFKGGVMLVIPVANVKKYKFHIKEVSYFLLRDMGAKTFHNSSSASHTPEYTVTLDYKVNDFRGRSDVAVVIVAPRFKGKTNIEFTMTVTSQSGESVRLTRGIDDTRHMAQMFAGFQRDLSDAFARGDFGSGASPLARAMFMLGQSSPNLAMKGLEMIRESSDLLAGLREKVRELAASGRAVANAAQDILDAERRRKEDERRKVAVLELGKKVSRKAYAKAPLKTIERIVAKREKAYVELSDQKFPPEIPAPALPAPLKLTQGQYESDALFAHRVQEAQTKRQREIAHIQKQYRGLVSDRNDRIAKLKALHEKRVRDIAEKRKIFIAEAVKEVFKGINITKPSYDRKNAILSFDLKATGAAYTQRIGVKIENPSLIEYLVKRPERPYWKASFKARENGFALESAVCRAGDALLDFRQMETGAILAQSRPQNVTIASPGADKLKDIAGLQAQAPDLSDYNSTVTLNYNDGRVVRVSGDTALASAVKRMAAAPANPRAWLLSIGIENYKAAPGVPFAENSQAVVSELLAKRFGVPGENQIVLSGDKAGGQAIRGHLKNLSARMGKDDILFFYYAGHGLAGKNGRDVYMLPSDVVRGAYEDEDFSFSNIIKTHFSRMGRVYAFLDTCFSGRADNQTMVMPGVAPIYKTTPHNLPGNVTVFFAGQGDQYANYYPDKGHRLFSYFLAKSLLKGMTDVKDLEREVKDNVRKVSTRMGADHTQEPFVGGNVSRPLGP